MTSLWLDRRPPTAVYDAPVPEQVDDLVVGAGLTGLVAATQLARAGRKVAVVEARTIGAVTTGHTTAKISLLQATKLSRIRGRHPLDVVRRYVEANRAGLDWLLEFCADRGVALQRREAVTYAADGEQLGSAQEEFRVATAAGLAVRWEDSWTGPVPNRGAVILPDQAQCDPVELLDALAVATIEAGGTIHEGRRLTSVSLSGRPEVTLSDGAVIHAQQVVLATGTPVLDRALHFARLSAKRSYLLAYTGIDDVEAMIISAGSPTRSLRGVPGDPGRVLVGGAGHTVGRTTSERAGVDELRTWVSATFPAAVETHAWSAQDYCAYDELPLVGALPLGGGRVHVATGYDKWGMTNGAAAALRIADAILGRRPGPWPEVAAPSPRSLLRAIGLNLEVAGLLVSGWAHAELTGREDPTTVHREGLVPTAGPPDCRIVGVCTHLGGVVHWNDAESTWDCPLHGSRFAADGTVLEGPATRPLPRRSAAWTSARPGKSGVDDDADPRRQ